MPVFSPFSADLPVWLIASVPAIGWLGIAIPAAISIGTSIWNAISGKKAAKKAADQQIAASNKAQGQLDTIYGGAMQNYQPYLQQGQRANMEMGRLMGLGGGQMPQSGQPMGQQQVPPPMARSGGAVMMRAPDGSTMAVPSQHVDHYRQRGAQVV
jgi:hypothetical protein